MLIIKMTAELIYTRYLTVTVIRRHDCYEHPFKVPGTKIFIGSVFYNPVTNIPPHQIQGAMIDSVTAIV